MRLNTLRPAPGAKKVPKRLGRGQGSGWGKTAGHGHKGQHARSGGYHKVGFEGGQMPYQRRLPKSGFNSPLAQSRATLYLSDLMKIKSEVIDLQVLIDSGMVKKEIKKVKIIAAGKINRAIIVRGLAVSSGAKRLIEAQNGKVESPFMRKKILKKLPKKTLNAS